jgi:DNA-directed RNA polymerase subunit RPC12/RpoP
MKCPHCQYPFTDEDVFRLVNEAVFSKARECDHVYTPDPTEPDTDLCIKCGWRILVKGVDSSSRTTLQ